MASTGLWASVTRSLRQLCSRRIYIAAMIGVPLFSAFFFLNLLGEGLPLKVPTTIVDMDNSSMSRQVVRSLSATELIEVRDKALTYTEALDKVKSGGGVRIFRDTRGFPERCRGRPRPHDRLLLQHDLLRARHSGLQRLQDHSRIDLGRIGQDHPRQCRHRRRRGRNHTATDSGAGSSDRQPVAQLLDLPEQLVHTRRDSPDGDACDGVLDMRRDQVRHIAPMAAHRPRLDIRGPWPESCCLRP